MEIEKIREVTGISVLTRKKDLSKRDKVWYSEPLMILIRNLVYGMENIRMILVQQSLKPVNVDAEASVGQVIKSENGETYVFTAESFEASPDLYLVGMHGGDGTWNGKRAFFN